MRYKFLIGIFIVLVSTILLSSNALASTLPGPWVNQTTLSNIDYNTSQDPENSGFGTIQVVVWEEYNGNDWDIWMKYSLLDGLLGSWIFPATQPATLPYVDEINPAVTITNSDPFGNTWIHVVYQRQAQGGLQWDVCHTYTLNFGGAWSAPTVLDINQQQDATDPAIVYTEDTTNPSNQLGMLAQIVWSENNPVTGAYEIKYNAFYLDISWFPWIIGYVGPFTIRAGGAGGISTNCLYPEIASIDENINRATCQFDFSVVWQEQSPFTGFWNIWYDDGTTQTTGLGGITTWLTGGSTGQLNVNLAPGDCLHPDIAATQDYIIVGGGLNEQYYYHVIWVFNDIFQVPPIWQIDNSFAAPNLPNPGAAGFAPNPIAQVSTQLLDNPTIATKLTAIIPAVFQIWMAWEDSTVIQPTNPDIWYNVGSFSIMTGFIYFGIGPIRVGYGPGAGWSIENNPELWNRNDPARAFPPLTHLVFDQTIAPTTEVEYIDP